MKKHLIFIVFIMIMPSILALDYNVTVPTGTKACYIAGEMNNWTQQIMVKVDETHYAINLPVATTSQAYKYCSGPAWDYEEYNANSQPISNRSYTASDVVIRWKAIYTPASGITYNVTVPVETNTCYIAGEMNGWVQKEMTKIDLTHFTITYSNATITEQYKYCSGPDWAFEELNADGSRVVNRTYTASDMVAKWTGVYNSTGTISPILNTLTLSSGTVNRYYFYNSAISHRTVDVWLPAGYTTSKKYAVLYMHDGQMLFDGTQTWNGQEWKVDETVTQLIQSGAIKDLIVVGIWNSSNRYSEYYPEKSLDYLPATIKTQTLSNMGNDPKADEYLSFIVNDLKPFIDQTYSVNTNSSNTFIGGSSMGGLISWYAMCEYPNIFGNAICMSTHWADNSVDNPALPDSFRKYLLAKLPDSATHKIYFDHGTVDLDANYAVNQVLVDTILKFKGYTANNFKSLVFTGDGHNETAWSNRFNVPLKFMLSNNSIATGIDMVPINNKINVLRLHKTRYNTTPAFSNFIYSFKILTETEYQAQKPSSALPFDVGFIATDGSINVSAPVTTAQKAVFADINEAALYYLCQSYIQFYYNTTALPVWLKVGFAAFEAHLNLPDATIKTALNAYGGSISSFASLNDPTAFNANNGLAISYAFGEYMNIYKNWGYPNMFIVDANTINVDPWWGGVNTLDHFLKVWNNYMRARFLEPTENLRIKLYLNTNHFKFYTREADSKNFPAFNNVLESAYDEYVTNFGVTASEKLTFFTLPECGIGADIEEIACGNRITGGTAWSSGLHSTCAATDDQIPLFVTQNRHELAHVFQGLFPQGSVTAWLNEGFAHFCALGPIVNDRMTEWSQYAIDAIKAGTTYFGHLPTYEDTKVYPSPDYGYYTLGYFLNDFIYRKGGYSAVKEVQLGDLAAYQKMGYSTCQAFLDDFYFDFDVRIQNKKIVTLINPTTTTESTTPTVNINWTPLKADAKLNIAVSTNNGTDWTTIATKTTSTSCTWDAASYTGKFLLKFSAPDNLNIETIYGPFTKVDLDKPQINFPNGNEYFIAGDTVALSWENTNISNLKIEYSANNGSDWNTVNSSVPAASKNYTWIVPNSASGNCKIRISSVSDNSKNDESDNAFTIVNPNQVGGPYLLDKNTILLMHFDNDLKNRSNKSGNGNGLISNITSDNTIPTMLGNCLNAQSPVTVSHNANLNLTGDWTIEAWVKATSFGANANMYILTKPGDANAYESNYSLEINPWWGNVFHGFYFSATNSRFGVYNFTPTLNQWYHIAFIRDTKNAQIKILIHDKNRSLVASQVTSYTGTETYLNTKDLIIGSGLNGFIDEVRISNVVRSFEPTNIDDIKTDDLFTVYPNPSNGLLQFKCGRNLNQNSMISLINLNGQIIQHFSVNQLKNNCLDLKNFPKGIYFIQLKSEENIDTKRVIIQ